MNETIQHFSVISLFHLAKCSLYSPKLSKVAESPTLDQNNFHTYDCK